MRAPSRGAWAQTFAQILCAVLGCVGAVPLFAGLFLRSAPAQAWAAGETSRILRQQLGVEANFSVELSLVPLRLAVKDLQVQATDSPQPALYAETVAVSPRFFSLLAGRIDVGDVELENSELRLVLEEGKITNVAYSFPARDPQRPARRLTRAPFRSLAVTNAAVDLKIDDTRIRTRAIDLDAIAEKDLQFDVALHAGSAVVRSTHRTLDMPPRGSSRLPREGTAYDEDRLCGLDLRVFASADEVLVRRLSLVGAFDSDARENVGPDCLEDDDDRVALRLSQFRVQLPQPGEAPRVPTMAGHVMLRGPLPILTRFVPQLPATGWAGFAGDLSYQQGAKLPEIVGNLTGQDLSIRGYAIAEKLEAEVLVADQVAQIPLMKARWGNGESEFHGIKVFPFKKGIPLSVERVSTQNIDFPGIMRDVKVTPHSWVAWDLGRTEISAVKGTVRPFFIDGAISGETKDFVVYNRGFDDPTHSRMVGIDHAKLDGRFRAHTKALQFYDTDIDFGGSHLPVELVSVGFPRGPLVVKMPEGGGTLDLADLSPIAGLEFAGESEVYVDVQGPMKRPVLKGDLNVKELMIAGFEAGNVASADVHFEPLFVEFSNLSANKGAMDYSLPKARLSFDGDAKFEFSSQVESRHFVLREFLQAFHLDQDPRFLDIESEGPMSASVRYLLGGPEDQCKGGRLTVAGTAQIEQAEAWGEKYSGGEGEFFMEWFDIEAGTRGVRLDVPHLSLVKGTGTVFGAFQMRPGGILSGDLIGTRIPLSRIDHLGQWGPAADGFISGGGRVAGTIDAFAVLAEIEVSPLSMGVAGLAGSKLQVKLVPEPPKPLESARLTACGRAIAEDVAQDVPTQDTVVVSGQLFGKQIELDNLALTRGEDPRLKGQASISNLDLSALAQLAAATTDRQSLPEGSLSGTLSLDDLSLLRPFESRAELSVHHLHMLRQGVSVDLEGSRAQLKLESGKLESQGLVLRATAGSGQSGVLDTSLLVEKNGELQAELKLRPTNLGVLSEALPGVARADGQLSGGFQVAGPWMSPRFSGLLQVEDGSIGLSEISSPITEIELAIAFDGKGMHVSEGTASWGGGQLKLSGNAPLLGSELGAAHFKLMADQVELQLDEGLSTQFDADLALTVPPLGSDSIPSMSGTVDLLRGNYQKAMSMTADISTLASRGEKTRITDYDPSQDALLLDILLTAAEPILVDNSLVQASLLIDEEGLRVSGSNQRFGAVGNILVESGGRVFLRRNEFELQGGLVRLSDPTQLLPEVDVTAVTEYRRYDDRSGSQGQDAASSDNSAGSPVAGNWRILLHAYGDPENLKIDLSSDPPLAQDDIFLLLTVGLTRTELDQSTNSGVGSSVALEALGSLSGAESAVTNVVPIDEFRFGSTYSSRSGKTEPTVTIGKRLSERIRASVTTSLSEASEVRSNVEYRATDNLSVEGSYDNARNVASRAGGNVGGDVRWRLEFK